MPFGAHPAAASWTQSTPWLVVSLCDGVGGVFACLDTFRLPSHGIVTEQDSTLREHSLVRNPHLTPVLGVAVVTADSVINYHERKQPAGVLLVGPSSITVTW